MRKTLLQNKTFKRVSHSNPTRKTCYHISLTTQGYWRMPQDTIDEIKRYFKKTVWKTWNREQALTQFTYCTLRWA